MKTDLQWAAPHSLSQDGQCKRPAQFCQSRSKAAFHQVRSTGSGLPLTRPGDCRAGNWLAPPRKMHPTHGPGCRGYCSLDCRREEGSEARQKESEERTRESYHNIREKHGKTTGYQEWGVKKMYFYNKFFLRNYLFSANNTFSVQRKNTMWQSLFKVNKVTSGIKRDLYLCLDGYKTR